MNRAFLPSLVRPALPLRKPASSPGSVNSSSTMPVTPQGDCSPQPQTQLTGSLDVGPNRNENEQTPVQINSPKVGSITMNLCNYCSKQGNLRCTSCKKTFYCSVACQTEDWRAHRHICKLSAQGNAASHKTNPSPSTPCGDEASVLESKINSGLVVEPKRIYVRDLRKNNISKGNEVQAVVVEIRTPAKFFIHIQSVEMAETLKSITVNLQKAYSGSLASVYKPEVGELCAVKFSLDQNWYRGGIESVDLHHQTAKVLYIDFGNEEEVKFDQIRPMMANIGSAPPCAMQCFIAGVTAVTGSWTGECCMLLRQLVAGKSLNFTVVNVLNSSTVFAVDAPLSTFGKNLSTFLIDKGYAIQDNSSTKPKIKQDIHSLMTASLENFKRLSDGKNKNNEAQPPDPLSQEVGDIFIAIVTHLQSPSEIICQKLENARIIQELQKSLRDQCCKTQAGENFRPAPGTVCCSLFSEDNQWYRAKVLGYSSEDRVCVGYIDFGNSEEVPLNQLRPISMDLLSLATQAIPCALAGINPTSDVWSEETVAVLKKLVCNRFIRVEILGEHDGKALVSMVDESSDPQTNVAELLVATGLAVVANLKPKKGEACESPDKLKWSCVKLPADGQKVVLVISVLESPGQFYCYNYNEDVLQTLTELSTALMKHCGADGTPFTPAVGEPCCALFSDGSWYRGIVQSLEGDGNVKVYFVDYGNTCEVQTSHLRAITPSLLKHPFQAISCWLAGIQPVDREWSKDAVQEFQTLCVGKQLNGRVLSVTEKGYGLELECNGCNVAAVLIAEQLAKPLSQKNKPEFQATSFTEPAEASSALEPAANDARIKQPAEITGQQLATPQSSTAIESASFPLDWKTVELPHGEPFQLQVAAVTSPGLFYVLNPREVKIEKLQCVMMDVMRYCSKQTLPNQSMPLPGAACCAQFSGDKNWYRAVVLEATSTYASVIYADYGNMERVSITSLLPIPKTLLQHPFQIARCALSGKEHFPTVWPVDVLELFGKQMSGKIMASVDHFDGTFNLLNVTEHSTQGGSSINFNILGLLKKSGKSSKKSTTKDTQEQEMEKTQPVCTPSVLAENLSTDTGNASGKENIKTVSASLEPTDPQTSADSTAVTTSNASASARYKALEEKDPEMCPSSRTQLLLVILLSQVDYSFAVQEIQADHETLMKITAAGEMMRCSAAMDVLFLMDGSFSVGKGGFERSRHCVLKLCEALDIGPDTVRVGVIQFGSTPRMEISLDSYSNRDELSKHIKKIQYRGGSTQSGLAFKYVIRKGFLDDRNSPVPRIVILLSDGKSQGPVQQAASELKQSGVNLFAVGLRYPRWEELYSLASTPTESHVFFAEHFSDAVNGLYTSLTTSSVCIAVPSGCQVESFPCARKTLERIKELQGNFIYTNAYKLLHTVCHRTVCSDPCDSQPCQNGGTCVSEGLEKYHCQCPPGYGSDPNCAPALSLDCSVDVLFLVESSTSLTLEGFLRFKAFLKRFVQTVLSSDTPVKIGLAQYGSDVKVEAKIGQHRDPMKLLQAVEALQYQKGDAKTGHALHYITRHGFQSTPVFADVQDDLPRIVVLITGTPSADSVVEPAKYARDREIFIIGLGPDMMKAEINNITGNPQRTITYNLPDGLNAKIPDLKAKICSVDSQGCLAQAVDLVFVLDGAGSVGKDNFVYMKEFVRSTSVHFDINRDLTQIGLVVYSRSPVSVFELDTHASGSAVLKAVDEASYLGGKASIGSALLHVHSHSLTVAKGARPGVHKVIVVLTDGTGAEDAAVPAQKIRDDGVSVFVIGTGDVQQEHLLRIAGSKDHIITVPFFEDLKYFEDVLVQMVCAESRQQPSRGDFPRPAPLRRRHRKNVKDLWQRYREHRKRHATS
ncbi:Tudor domain-containing protein 1 [Bagarius yarrelli]|uniref:Tudor domain-containing protein 1 n=1 Tax=Bagarius yarrelli TaxID=175774 RepID=A0A556TJ33_BAGYA|nr:Tudor domain-containing protein 1 [Bagarius yarrelli]